VHSTLRGAPEGSVKSVEVSDVLREVSVADYVTG
jgi:hypothetical protein